MMGIGIATDNRILTYKEMKLDAEHVEYICTYYLLDITVFLGSFFITFTNKSKHLRTYVESSLVSLRCAIVPYRTIIGMKNISLEFIAFLQECQVIYFSVKYLFNFYVL